MTIKRWTLAVVCIATAMLMMDIAVVNTALSRIAEDLHANLNGLQWVVDAYTLALAATVLTAGSLADRFGRRRVFSIGLTIFTIASAACAASSGITELNIYRAVQGIGAAVMFAVSLALLANAFPEARERGGALAAYGATIGASFAIGPLVGGALTSALDWQWIFLINVPLGIACIWITWAKVTESKDPRAPRVDWPGQATLAPALFLLVLALLRGNTEGWGSTVIVAELVAAAALLIAFVVVEARVRQPMLPLGAFRNPSFTGAQIAAFGISASFFASYFYVTLYLQQVLGLSPIEAGLSYMPMTLVVFFVSAATSQLGERISARTMVSAGLALVGAGMALIVLAKGHSSWTVLLPGELLAGIGTGLFNPAVSAVALGSLPETQSGLAAGVNDTARQAGITIGVAALGALIPAAGKLGHISPDAFVNGMHHAFIAGSALALVAAIASAFLIRPTRHGIALEGELAMEGAGA